MCLCVCVCVYVCCVSVCLCVCVCVRAFVKPPKQRRKCATLHSNRRRAHTANRPLTFEIVQMVIANLICIHNLNMLKLKINVKAHTNTRPRL